MGACVAVFLSAQAQGSGGDLFEKDAPSAFATPGVVEREPNPLLWGISHSPAKPISDATSEVKKPKGVLFWGASPSPAKPFSDKLPDLAEMQSILLGGINSAPADTLATPVVGKGYYSPPKKRARAGTLLSSPSSASSPGSASTGSGGIHTPTPTKRAGALSKRQKSAIPPYGPPSIPAKNPEDEEK